MTFDSPVIAIESARTLPSTRVVFDYATIICVVDGLMRVETPAGRHELEPGWSLTLGAGTWRSLEPSPAARVWTIYVKERFLREQLTWTLPEGSRLLPGIHAAEWDGSATIQEIGVMLVRRIEPLLRQISIINASDSRPELIPARAVSRFSRALELVMPALLDHTKVAHTSAAVVRSPVLGSLTRRVTTAQVARASMLLRARMSETWTVERLARETALSKSHLTRLFINYLGVAPIQFLVEVRLTEFARLVEETELSRGEAARQVGWQDSRIAAAWFRRRYRVSPSQFRRHPHPAHESCAL